MSFFSATLAGAVLPHGTDDLPSRVRAAAERVMERCDQLATCSEDATQLTRTFCSPAMAKAHTLLRLWMTAAGMTTRLDPVANFIGRHGPESTGRVLLIGSHLDTVVNAGRFDGPLGVLLGIGLVELLREEPACLPFFIEVIGFCEEEGIRYRTPFIGSRAVTGTLDPSLLDRLDDCGVPMRSAIANLCSVAPDRADSASYRADQVIGYIEPHIEQGPLLEQENLPVGIVEAIAGQTRAAVRFLGRAGHAGTVPMALRKDALAGAAEWISQVEALAQKTSGAVATVGQLSVNPNVTNVIPSEVNLRLDTRHQADASRAELVAKIFQVGEIIAVQRGLEFIVDWQEHFPAVALDAGLSAQLAGAVGEAGVGPYWLTSGAGHDAAVMAEKFPAAMLFLRCREGLSHHPDESVRADDVAVALEVLLRLISGLCDEHGRTNV